MTKNKVLAVEAYLRSVFLEMGNGTGREGGNGGDRGVLKHHHSGREERLIKDGVLDGLTKKKR